MLRSLSFVFSLLFFYSCSHSPSETWEPESLRAQLDQVAKISPSVADRVILSQQEKWKNRHRKRILDEIIEVDKMLVKSFPNYQGALSRLSWAHYIKGRLALDSPKNQKGHLEECIRYAKLGLLSEPAFYKQLESNQFFLTKQSYPTLKGAKSDSLLSLQSCLFELVKNDRVWGVKKYFSELSWSFEYAETGGSNIPADHLLRNRANMAAFLHYGKESSEDLYQRLIEQYPHHILGLLDRLEISIIPGGNKERVAQSVEKIMSLPTPTDHPDYPLNILVQTRAMALKRALIATEAAPATD